MRDWDHESLVQANRYLPGDVQEEFEKSKVDFLKMGPGQRIEFMRPWQVAIEQDGRATPGTAQLWRQLRDLEALHFSLLKVQR